MPRGRIPVKNPRTAYRQVDGHGMLVVVDSRELHTLNEVAARVWALCDGRAVEAIVSEIVSEFEIDASTAGADVDVFLASLDRIGAVTWAES